MMPVTKSPLTKTQRRKVARLYSEGMGPKDIATELGEPRKTIAAFISTNYLTSNGDYMSKKPNHSVRVKSDVEERNVARRMRDEGLMVTEIAMRMRRSRSAIRQWLKTYD